MESRTNNRLAFALAALCLAAPSISAQTEGDEPGQGRAEDSARPRDESSERPGAAPFEPPENAEERVIEEIVVIGGQDQWRLPDLGDTFRAEQEALQRQRPTRVEVEFLPLYDPESPQPDPDLFRMFDPEQRVGTVELFRFRFGGR